MQHYDVHSKVSIEEVFTHINRHLNGKRALANVNGMLVKVNSMRLLTFHKTGTVCHACGLQATHFELNRDSGATARDDRWHLNLWGEKDGEPVLFTQDHKIARALGGTNNISNTETMCSPCNRSKGFEEKKELDKRNALTTT